MLRNDGPISFLRLIQIQTAYGCSKYLYILQGQRCARSRRFLVETTHSLQEEYQVCRLLQHQQSRTLIYSFLRRYLQVRQYDAYTTVSNASIPKPCLVPHRRVTTAIEVSILGGGITQTS